ncbi:MULTISPECIES: hypothetical protein [Chitinophagaceae]
MQKVWPAIIVGGLILVLTSCNSDSAKIKTVITSFFTALNRKDPQSAKLYATKESADVLSLIQQQLIANPDKTQNTNEKFLISDIKINGDIATASVRSETQQNPLTVTVKKEGKDWKVAFDKSNIATMMGMDANHQPSSTEMDSVNKQDITPTAPGQTLNLADTSVTPASK